jgi:arsenite methyltransferase
MSSSDRWAEWLRDGQWHGLSAAERRRAASHHRRVRDRVLRGARLRKGHRVLDVGAGTGLVALEARRRVGVDGRVAAVDVSADALRECRAEADREPAAARLFVVQGLAERLPLRDGSVDAALTRSVLIYVEDKPRAIRELHRVLASGGSASIFEPINSAPDDDSRPWRWGLDLSGVQPAHDRVVEWTEANWEHREPMLGFDERSLVAWFRDAGFTRIELHYELERAKRPPLSRREAIGRLTGRPNPTITTYEEAARAVLGDAADGHLERLAGILCSQPLTETRAAAYLTARR